MRIKRGRAHESGQDRTGSDASKFHQTVRMWKMNKYMGFYELKSINLPSVPWRLFTADTAPDGNLLWTVRVAVERDNDLNLPRAVGVSAGEAIRRGNELLRKYKGKGIVIYYPYFIAQKSGVLDIGPGRTVIEAVDGDLWNLVTYGRKNVTAMIDSGGRRYLGDEAFLSPEETDELLKYGAVIRGRYRDILNEGGSVLAEWSYAYDTDTGRRPTGERYLVFYELRRV